MKSLTYLNEMNWGKRASVVLAMCVAAAIASPAQTPTTLANFNGTNGAQTGMGMTLIQATNGNFYGTSPGGGSVSPGYGTVFEITPAGKLTTIYNFCSKQVPPLGTRGLGCADGADPAAGLVQGTNGGFYGTTPFGGVAGGPDGTGGTIFRITASGALTTLYNFCSQTNCSDGSYPNALVLAANGDLYGTTNQSGANNAGTVFKITPAGTLTTLYNFCSQTNCTDGGTPFGALVQAAGGNFYGTTWNGGTNNTGTIFRITPAGALTTIYSFGGLGYPSGALVQAANGEFYGTTARGGTVFRVTPAGVLTTLGTVGGYPYAGLVQATNGDFYGTTYVGGANNNSYCQGDGCGTIFRITPAGKVTTLYNFCSETNCTDGAWPLAGMMQATNGSLYGTTIGGGVYGDGTVFGLDVELGPFVETQTTSGKVGAAVEILGTDLTGATSVTFNGAESVFTVVRPSEISTTVPAGASSGTVQVITPNGTLSSKVSFLVLP